MTSLLTPDEQVRIVLDVFAHFRARAGHVLRANHFVTATAHFEHSGADVDDGLEAAQAAGYVELTQNGGIKLTAAGFVAM